jgi:ATP-dependent exoDNAse (exonuclease V) beta subunit
MNAIHLISASAGSGKTHRLVDALERAITSVENPVRPEAVIATTFTVKASAELRERVRARLLEQGLVAEAQRLAMARIGTVHSVCASLVTEFAFELGLPPETRTLEDDAARAAFERSLASLVSTTRDEDDTVLAGSSAATALLDLEDRMPGLDWLKRVREIVEQARANRSDPEDLRACASRSADSLLAYIPPSARDGAALEQALREALDAFIGNKALDPTKTTAGVVEVCERALAPLRRGKTLPWTEWSRLAAAEPGAKSRTFYEPVREAARAYERHPQLVADLRVAIANVFELAAQALEAYQKYKLQWGLIDFVDQERLALQLLERPQVREILAEQLDLVLVDEFQDTSPLQLEVFLALAHIAPRSVWVGDQKQAIYGFRGTDPGLMDATVAAIELRAGAGALETLGHSWRSRAELVWLTSDVFAPAFDAQGIPASRVRLAPAPSTADPDALGPVVEVWRLTARRKDEEAGALATAVAQLLSDDAVKVRDVLTDAARSPRPADVAILCRTNNDARRVGAALEGLGVSAVLGRPGLIATLEARVVLAALRLWVDGRDSLATAELGRLVSLPHDPDAWLNQVLDAQGRPFQDLAEVTRIASARSANPAGALLTAFDAALDEIGARELCLRWGSDTQRLANLDRLRSHAVRYADLCEAERQTPTMAGLVAHLESLADDDRDEQATPGGQDAVTVSTLHGAKGLEWPVTVLYGLDSIREPNAFGVRVVSERDTFLFEDPLGGRWIRYWPDPFQPKPFGPGMPSNYKGNTTLHAAVRNGVEYLAEAKRSASENLRLLYVGWTRARDVLVLASRDGKLLDGALGMLTGTDGAQLLAEPGGNGVASWAGRVVNIRVRATAASGGVPVVIEPGEGYVVRGPRQFPPATVNPSSLSGIGTLGEPESLGGAVPVSVGADPTSVGDACHAFFAADGDDLDEAERVAMAARLLQSFSVQGSLRAEDLARAGTSLRGWAGRHWPGATWRREWPLRRRLSDGSELHGFADLVLETSEGLVLIDHKCLGGTLTEALAAAASYGAQLAAYVDVLERATGRDVLGRWLHLPLQGVSVEVR